MGKVPVNADMIFLARTARGMLGKDLAAEVGVSAGLISKAERGAITPSDALVAEIARATSYPAHMFYRPEHVRGTDSICFHHRKRPSISAKVLDGLESQMYLTQLQVKVLLDGLEIQSPNDFVTLDPDEYEQGPKSAAQILRGLWKLPSGPISSLVRVVESAGAVVVMRDFGTTKLDGMSCWAKGCPPLFFLNSAMPADRTRLTLAHELGHLVMHAHAPAGDPEREANEFAMEFLAPSAEILPDLKRLQLKSLPALKTYWGISMNALVMAAQLNGALPDSRLRSLWVQLSQRGWRTREPFELDAETPSIVEDAIKVQLGEHGYTIGELAQIADLELAEFRELYVGHEGPQRHLRLA
jgi:Zn-dependent peptidase ImmA (M78 family)/transcriptional regulator with XRE-family HTH domain